MNPNEETPKDEISKEVVDDSPKKVDIKRLRTYQGDIEEALGKNRTSTVDIFVAEQERKETKPLEPEVQVNNQNRNKIFLWVGLSLLFISIVTVSGVYYIRARNEIVQIKKTKALIAFTEEKTIEMSGLKRDQLIKQILGAKSSFKSPINSVLYINTANNKIPIDRSVFLNIMAPKMPSSLIRAFDKEYMLGVYSYDTDEVFIILTTKDFANSYSGMLSWEKNIPEDLNYFFEIGTTSKASFVDEAFRNKDLRVLKNDKGKTVLVYSFIDRETLVITKNQNILNSVMSKYLISKQNKG